MKLMMKITTIKIHNRW